MPTYTAVTCLRRGVVLLRAEDAICGVQEEREGLGMKDVILTFLQKSTEDSAPTIQRKGHGNKAVWATEAISPVGGGPGAAEGV